MWVFVRGGKLTASNICRWTLQYFVSAIALCMEVAGIHFCGRRLKSAAGSVWSKKAMACDTTLMTAASLKE